MEEIKIPDCYLCDRPRHHPEKKALWCFHQSQGADGQAVGIIQFEMKMNARKICMFFIEKKARRTIIPSVPILDSTQKTLEVFP